MGLSVLYMNSRVSAVVNLIQTLATCWAYNQHQVVLDSSPIHVCRSEILSWFLTTLFCVCSESWFKEFSRVELDIINTKHAVERMLTGMCDSVVRLNFELRITNAGPHLMHLLCPSRPVNPRTLDDTLFSSLLATERDEDAFAAFVSSGYPDNGASPVGGHSPALRVGLRYGENPDASVELFHSPIGHLQHLIGIREVRKEGHSPDESLLQDEQHLATPVALLPNIIAEGESQARNRPQITGSIKSGTCSSSSGSSAFSKIRQLVGLENLEVIFDLDNCIHQYACCFTNADSMNDSSGAQGSPTLRDMLVGSGSTAFLKWLVNATNTLLSGDMPYLEYDRDVLFQPQTAACASSSVVLCAQPARVSVIQDLHAPDGSEVFKLKFSGIAQISKRRHESRHNASPLEPVLEASHLEA